MSTRQKRLKRETIYADCQTGEVIKTEQQFTATEVERNRNFALFFGEKIAEFYKLNNQQKNVLATLSIKMELSTNCVIITSPLREEWANAIGISVPAFNNALHKLMKVGVVVKIGLGVYMIDPLIYSKSNYADRIKSNEVFRMKLVYEVDMRDEFSAKKVGIETEVIRPDKMTIDPETGEAIYTRKGKPCAAPTPDDVVESYRAKRTADES